MCVVHVPNYYRRYFLLISSFNHVSSTWHFFRRQKTLHTLFRAFVWARVRSHSQTHAHFFECIRPLYCAHKLHGLFAICVNYSTTQIGFLDKHNKIIITHPQSICICSVTNCVNKVDEKSLSNAIIFCRFLFLLLFAAKVNSIISVMCFFPFHLPPLAHQRNI